MVDAAESLKLFVHVYEKINKDGILAILEIYTSSVEVKRYGKIYSKYTHFYSYVPTKQIFDICLKLIF